MYDYIIAKQGEVGESLQKWGISTELFTKARELSLGFLSRRASKTLGDMYKTNYYNHVG